MPGGSDSKEYAHNVGDLASIPGLGRSSEERQMATHSRILAWRIPRLPVTSLQWLQDPHWVLKQAVVPSLIPVR